MTCHFLSLFRRCVEAVAAEESSPPLSPPTTYNNGAYYSLPRIFRPSRSPALRLACIESGLAFSSTGIFCVSASSPAESHGSDSGDGIKPECVMLQAHTGR